MRMGSRKWGSDKRGRREGWWWWDFLTDIPGGSTWPLHHRKASACLHAYGAMPYVGDHGFHEILIKQASHRMAGTREGERVCLFEREKRGECCWWFRLVVVVAVCVRLCVLYSSGQLLSCTSTSTSTSSLLYHQPTTTTTTTTITSVKIK